MAEENLTTFRGILSVRTTRFNASVSCTYTRNNLANSVGSNLKWHWIMRWKTDRIEMDLGITESGENHISSEHPSDVNIIARTHTLSIAGKHMIVSFANVGMYIFRPCFFLFKCKNFFPAGITKMEINNCEICTLYFADIALTMFSISFEDVISVLIFGLGSEMTLKCKIATPWPSLFHDNSWIWSTYMSGGCCSNKLFAYLCKFSVNPSMDK